MSRPQQHRLREQQPPQQQQQQQQMANLFTGYGLPKPQSRALSSGMFGLVEDAFASRTLDLSNSTQSQKFVHPSCTSVERGAAVTVDTGINVSDAFDSRIGANHNSNVVEPVMLEQVSVAVELQALPWQGDKSSQSRLIIKGGRLINDDQAFDGDLYIEDGIIKQIGQHLVTPGGARVIDAKGKLVLPGGIDTNTRLQFVDAAADVQSADDYYSGTRAALAGGTTMIMDLVPAAKDGALLDAYTKQRLAADSKVCCDYGLHVAVGCWNEQVLRDMETLVKDKGISSFWVSMADEAHPLYDSEIYHIFRKCRDLGAVVQVLAENAHLIKEKSKELVQRGVTGPEGHALSRPEEIEGEATRRAITIAHQADCPLYVANITSKTAASEISAARKKGCIVYGGSTAAALGTDGSHHWNTCWRHAAGHVTTPPLRPDPTTPGVLTDLLSSGDLEASGSDHCTFNANQKALGKDDFRKIPSGVNGVEDRMSVLWEKGVCTGKMDACKFVAVTSTNAAKLFNIYPQKGRIAVGSDADLVVWDSETTRTISAKTHNQTVDFNIFEGMICHGVPTHVVKTGRVVLDEEGLHVSQGAGQFVQTTCHSPYVYGRQLHRAKAIVSCSAPVAREPYTGPVVDRTDATDGNSRGNGGENPITATDAGAFHSRPPTRSGGRHMQDSSFALNGEQIDESATKRSHQKVTNPPGGRSTGLW